MQHNNERRKKARSESSHACTLKSGATYYPGKVLNITVNGACVRLDEPCDLMVGICVLFTVFFKTDEASLNLGVQAQVAWIREKNIGLTYIERKDENLKRLRRLIDVQLGNLNA